VPDPGHVQTSSDISYTTLPGCRLTKAQDKKVLEIADTMESEIPLHVAAMDKQNIHSKDSFVVSYILSQIISCLYIYLLLQYIWHILAGQCSIFLILPLFLYSDPAVHTVATCAEPFQG
jgi:hypothetical protein